MHRPRRGIAYGVLLVGLWALSAGWPSGSLAAAKHPDKVTTKEQGGQTSRSSASVKAEWLPLRRVLVHLPADELFTAAIHPEAARAERPFNVAKAQTEQRAMFEALKKTGAQVITVAEALLDGAVDKHGAPIPGEKLEELRAFAAMFLTFDASSLSIEEQAKQEAYKRFVIDSLHPAELVKIILMQPTVRLLAAESNAGYVGVYEFSPVNGLVFCRDFCIVTAKGLVLGRLSSPQRGVESEIMKFVLHQLGIRPLFEVQGEGRLEGGDFFALGGVALLGQGLRTNEEAVRQLLQSKVFGAPRVAVVKDPGKNPEESHLDAYFNVLGPKLAVLAKERYEGRDPAQRSLVDIYELEGGAYVLKKQDIDFRAFLEKDLGFTLIPVTREDQRELGLDFLPLGPQRILAVDGVSDAYKKALKDNAASAVWLELKQRSAGFGGRSVALPLSRDSK